MKKCKIKYMSTKCIGKNCICEKMIKAEKKLAKHNGILKMIFEIIASDCN